MCFATWCRLSAKFTPPPFLRSRIWLPKLGVAIDALAAVVTFLGLDRQSCNRTGIEPLERNRLAGLFATAIRTVFNATLCRLDFGNQIALSVAGAQFSQA